MLEIYPNERTTEVFAPETFPTEEDFNQTLNEIEDLVEKWTNLRLHIFGLCFALRTLEERNAWIEETRDLGWYLDMAE